MPPRVVRKALLAPSDFPSYSQPSAAASPALPFEKRKPVCEFAGVAFHAWQRRVCGVTDEPVDPTRTGSAMNQSVVSEEDAEERMLREAYEERKKEHGVDPHNYYELLGIGHLGMIATEKQVRVFSLCT